MRCICCKQKFKPDQNRCASIPKNVCEKCSLEGKISHQCDLSCSKKLPIEIDSRPLSSSVIGLNPMGEIRGVEEDFFPAIYNLVCCNVENLIIDLKEMHQIHISIDFSLTGNASLLGKAYKNEDWKYQHVSECKKENGVTDGHIAHLFATHLWSGLKLIDNSTKLFIDGKKVPVITNPNVDFIGLPDSYPPDKKNPVAKDINYSFYLGKFVMFYGPLLFNCKYHIEYDIEAINFFYETGYLFPFKYVDIKNIDIKGNSQIIPGNILFQRVEPKRMSILPSAQRIRWFREIGDIKYPPMIYPADPFRDTKLYGVGHEPKTFLNNKPYFNLNDFTLVRTGFMPALANTDDLYIRIRITDSPLPIRVFDQLQRLPRYRDFLIEYDLINFSGNPVDVEIISEINGITDQVIDNFTIPAKKNSDGKPSRIVEFQYPNVKFGILEQVTEPIEATLTYQINIKGKKGKTTPCKKGTKTIKILPHDVIVWSIKDKAGNSVYDLSKMIGSWVTPCDKDGTLDEIRGKAKNYHPSKILVGNQCSLEDITLQIKALYDYLNEESGISYVEQSSFKHTFDSNAQRILLPERVIKARTGNCIDLTALFASLMEGLGINPLILLTSDHAFLGWGNKYSKDKMGFLECTMLGVVNQSTGKKFTFEEAYEVGKTEFMDKFILKGASEYLPIHSITFGKDGSQIIDISEVRKEGIKRI